MTKREILTSIIEGNYDYETVKAYAEHEIELLDKKVANSKKESKITEEILETCLNALTVEGVTIKEIIASDPMFKGYTSQKVVPVLRKLMERGLVEKFYEKRVAYFKKVG